MTKCHHVRHPARRVGIPARRPLAVDVLVLGLPSLLTPPAMATSSPTDEANTHSLVPPPPLRVSVPVDVAADNDDDDEFPQSRPSPLALSPSALELVPEPDGSPDAALFEFSDEEEDGLDDAPVGMAGALSRLSAGPVPPMPPLHVLLFALAPSLRLGAFLLPYESTPLVKSIPVLLFFGGMSTLARQIWYMLARYVGTADVETVIANTFARAPRRVKARQLIRMGTRAITGIFRVLLATIYLRGSYRLTWAAPCSRAHTALQKPSMLFFLTYRDTSLPPVFP
jgi:hypothetical protein